MSFQIASIFQPLPIKSMGASGGTLKNLFVSPAFSRAARLFLISSFFLTLIPKKGSSVFLCAVRRQRGLKKRRFHFIAGCARDTKQDLKSFRMWSFLMGEGPLMWWGRMC